MPLDLTLSDLESLVKFKVNHILKPYISQRSLVRPYVTINHQ